MNRKLLSATRMEWLIVATAIFVAGFLLFVRPRGTQAVQQCPLSQGYWQNHPEAWPRLALVLGDPSNPAHTYTQSELLALLKTPAGRDASIVLAQQLIAAKLNIFNGSNPAPIASALTQADSLFGNFPGKLPYQVRPNTAMGKSMVAVALR